MRAMVLEAPGSALRPADLPMVGGQFLMTRRAFLASDRALVVGFGRSVCKASRFVLANPRAGARAFLKMFPETAPRGSSTERYCSNTRWVSQEVASAMANSSTQRPAPRGGSSNTARTPSRPRARLRA